MRKRHALANAAFSERPNLHSETYRNIGPELVV